MPDAKETLRELFDTHPAAPFLFVGSGFSRRYLGLESWSDLLSRFCDNIRDFGYYNSASNGSLPIAATLMAKDYHDWWWTADERAMVRQEFGSDQHHQADALKFDIAQYVASYSLDDARSSDYAEEIAAFSEITVDGIITTNWDSLLDELFPDYKVFIGQSELLFSNSQAIGEIYKIHGSTSQPKSLVLTGEDYEEFSEKNPYLAAKLVTIFVEHPIVFLGYSITDPHIQRIITSIARCLDQEKIASFEKNMVFVQRAKDGEAPSIEKTTIQSDGFSVTLMVAKLSSFLDIYEALKTNKRKVPARVLRFFKEQLYELVHTPNAAQEKMAVINYEDIESADDVEFVVGIGVAKKQAQHGEIVDSALEKALSKKGYSGVTATEVFKDCVSEESAFEASDLLSTAYRGFARSHRRFLPVFRYLQSIGIDSTEKLAGSNLEGAKKIVGKLSNADYTLPSYHNRFRKSFNGLSTDEIIEKASSSDEALLMLPFASEDDTDLERLRMFLETEADTFLDRAPYETAYRKLVCYYDKTKYGFV